MKDERTRIPAAGELIEAVAGFLEQELLPGLQGRQQFNTRVCINALRIVQRELTQAVPAQGEAELRRRLGAASGSLDELVIELAARIRNGGVAVDDPALLKLLRALTQARLAVDSPKYAEGRD